MPGAVCVCGIWQAAPSRRIWSGAEDEIHSLALTPDGKLLADTDRDDVVQVWDLATRNAGSFRHLHKFNSSDPIYLSAQSRWESGCSGKHFRANANTEYHQRRESVYIWGKMSMTRRLRKVG